MQIYILEELIPRTFVRRNKRDIKSVDKHLTALSKKLKLSKMETARGIIRIANNNMTNALKLISVNKGHDPRDFTLVAFGGGGGMHATF